MLSGSQHWTTLGNWNDIYYPHLNCLVIPPTQNLLHLPPLLSFYVMTLFFICKIFKEGKLWGVDLKAIQNFFLIFFFVSTLNSIGCVLCSAAVSGWLKMRKFLGIYYYQDVISGVEVNNNVINISKL